MIEHVQKLMTQKKYRDEKNIEIKKALKLAEEKKNEINYASYEDKKIISVMYQELERLCNLTISINDEIKKLVSSQSMYPSSVLELELNTLQSKLERTNYQAWEQKKAIRRELDKFKIFTMRIPERFGYNIYDIQEFEYKKTDKFVQEMDSKVEKTKSYGELVMIEYNKQFNNITPGIFN